MTVSANPEPATRTPHASDGARTLPEAFRRVVASRPDEIALRTVGGGVTVTFRELAEDVERHARGLASLGLHRGDTIALMMANRVEFYPVDIGAQHLGVTSFSVYNTLPVKDIEHVLSNSAARFVVCEAQYVQRLVEAGMAPEYLVVLDTDASEAPAGTRTLEAVLADGDPSLDVGAARDAVEGTDVATLIYTSGTTGPSKGVECTHEALLAESRGVAAVLDVRDGDRMTSFMPSAHIADRLTALYWLETFGLQITVVSDPSGIAAALRDCRPTIWGAVPRVWEKLKAGVELAVAAEPDERRRAGMRWALDTAARFVDVQRRGEQVPEELAADYSKAEQAVLGPLRERIGFGETRWAMSGAAPVAPDTLAFFVGLGLPISEIWGQSECTCIATCGGFGPTRLGTVGRVIPGVEMRLAEDGEVFLRGPIVMKGYRGQPGKTAETVDADGWLATGDVGTLDEDGYLTIVDRKKELIINSTGKNMSPARIEKAVGAGSDLVGEVVVIGEGRPYNVGLVALDAEVAAATAERLGVPVDAAVLARHPEVVAEVRSAVARGNAELSRAESIRRFAVVPTFWVPGGEELTLTMKIRRRPIATRYADLIEQLYAPEPDDEVVLVPAVS